MVKITTKYRPIAPNDLDGLVNRLEELSVQTILPWQYNEKTKAFYVEIDGEQCPINFQAGDPETEIVLAMSKGLPLIMEALYNRFYFMHGDKDGRQKIQKVR